jgi:hypothetical protein
MLAAASMALAAPASVSAREFGDITGPYFDRYGGDWKKVRKEMRKRLKKGEAFSGDDWFTLAAMCAIEPPGSASIIMNLMNKPPCKGEVIEYFTNAGNAGTPRGFLMAATYQVKYDGDALAALESAQLAYRLSGQDTQLAGDALDKIGELQVGAAQASAAQSRAETRAAQLVSSSVYSAAQASQSDMAAASLPQLSWLDFDNPKRCQWSQTAYDVVGGAMRNDETTNYSTRPATTRVPGIAGTVTGRISRPARDAPSYVVIDVDFRGRWNGLTVVGLTDSLLEESHGVYGKGIRFAEPVREVAAALSRAGFVVNADGSVREQVDKELKFPYVDERGRKQVARNIDGVETSITRKGGETVFLCNEMFEASYGE